jgi:hypothetical protein
MKITIERQERGWRVKCEGRYEDCLAFDEALGCVAKLMILGHDAETYLRTPEQHEAWRREYGPKTDEERLSELRLLEDKRAAQDDANFPDLVLSFRYAAEAAKEQV